MHKKWLGKHEYQQGASFQTCPRLFRKKKRTMYGCGPKTKKNGQGKARQKVSQAR